MVWEPAAKHPSFHMIAQRNLDRVEKCNQDTLSEPHICGQQTLNCHGDEGDHVAKPT